MYTWPITHTYAYLHFLAQQRVRLPSSRSISVLNSRWIFHPTVVTTAFTDIPDERERSISRKVAESGDVESLKGTSTTGYYISQSIFYYYDRSITFKNLWLNLVYHSIRSTPPNSRSALIYIDSWLHYHWQQLSSFIPDEVIHSLTKFSLKL